MLWKHPELNRYSKNMRMMRIRELSIDRIVSEENDDELNC